MTRNMDYKVEEGYRKAALDLYNILEKEESERISSTLKIRKKQLEEGKFLLAVIGEAKAGKSTFLNALLMDEVLPSDVLQSTSAVIEIVKSKTKSIKVFYANGSNETVEEYFSDFLKKIGSVQDDFRDLPIVQLNMFLKKHWDNQSKATWTILDLEILCDDVDNSHNVERVQFRLKIEQYLDRHKTLNIPDKIQIGFPLNFEFDGFTLVDTPGVNAVGGIEDLTKDFLGNANAIIYVHKIKPIESKSLHSFLTNYLPDHLKSHLLLVLSHIKDETSNDVTKLVEEANKIYCDIPSSNIVPVDSLTELNRGIIAQKTFEEIERLADDDEKFEKMISTHLRKAKGDKDKLLELMEVQSKFDTLRARINKFSKDAAAIQIKDVVDRIKGVCEEIDDELSAKIIACESAVEKPQTFSENITKTKDEMEELKAELRGTIATWQDTYNLTSKASKYWDECTKLTQGFEEQINGKTFDSSDTLHTRKSFIGKIYVDYAKELDDLAIKIHTDLMVAVASKISEYDKKYIINVPKVDLIGIWDIARESSTKDVDRKSDKPGSWNALLRHIPFTDLGTETKAVRELDLVKFWEASKSKINNELLKQKESIAQQLADLASKFCAKYDERVCEELDIRKDYLDQLNNKRELNESREQELLDLKTKKASISVIIGQCKKQIGQL